MKKNIILFLALAYSIFLCTTSTAQESKSLPQRGYVGEVSLGLGGIISEQGFMPMGELSTTHGYQFNSRWFLGGGVATINTQYLSFFGAFSVNLRRPSAEHPSFPYFGLRVGYTFSTWTSDKFGDEKGLYIDPQLGWSFYSKAGRLRYNTFIAASFFNFTLVPRVGFSVQF